MKTIKFNLRDLNFPEGIIYGFLLIMGIILYNKSSNFWGSVFIFYLIFEVTLRRFEIIFTNKKVEMKK